MRDRPTTTAREIRTAVTCTADLDFVVHLMNTERNRVGFFAAAALAWYVSQGLCRTAFLHGRHAGILFGRPSMRYARWCRPVTALVVAEKARRQGVATALLVATATTAVTAGQDALQAWTRRDLFPAHCLWERFAFKPICFRQPSTADAVPLTLWRYSLQPEPHPDFHTPPPVAGWKGGKITAIHSLT